MSHTPHPAPTVLPRVTFPTTEWPTGFGQPPCGMKWAETIACAYAIEHVVAIVEHRNDALPSVKARRGAAVGSACRHDAYTSIHTASESLRVLMSTLSTSASTMWRAMPWWGTVYPCASTASTPAGPYVHESARHACMNVTPA